MQSNNGKAIDSPNRTSRKRNYPFDEPFSDHPNHENGKNNLQLSLTLPLFPTSSSTSRSSTSVEQPTPPQSTPTQPPPPSPLPPLSFQYFPMHALSMYRNTIEPLLQLSSASSPSLLMNSPPLLDQSASPSTILYQNTIGPLLQLSSSSSPTLLMNSPTTLLDQSALPSTILYHNTIEPPLQLSSSSSSSPSRLMNPPPLLNQSALPSTRPRSYYNRQDSAGPSRAIRTRRTNSTGGKSETIDPAPYPWATTLIAHIHSLDYLMKNQILIICGEVQCKECERKYEVQYDLRQKFMEVGTYIAQNKESMKDRAPKNWTHPVLPTCKFCVDRRSSVKPIISSQKSSINWLFLLLGQMLGCCTLEQLKFFCEHTETHRTGSKDHVLYSTYLGLCRQLDPQGPFYLCN